MLGLPALISACITAFMSYYCYFRVKDQLARSFAIFAALISLWSLGSALELFSTTFALQLLFAKVQHFGVAFVGISWLLFLQKYLLIASFSRTKLALLAVIPALSLVLIFSNEFHGLIWSDVQWNAATGKAEFSRGLWFRLIYAPYNYVLLFTGLGQLSRALYQAHKEYRGQMRTVILAAILPLFVNLMYLLDLSNSVDFDLTPLSFGISGLAILSAFWGQRLSKRNLIFQQELFNASDDALFILDLSYQIIDLNTLAADILMMPEDVLRSQNIYSFLPTLAKWENLTEPLKIMNYQLGTQYFDINIIPVQSKAVDQKAYVLSLKDVTRQQKDAIALRQAAAFRGSLLSLVKDLMYEEVNEAFYERILNHAIKVIPNAEMGSVLQKKADGFYHFVAVSGFDKSALEKISFTKTELIFQEKAKDRENAQIFYHLADFNAAILDKERETILNDSGAAKAIKATLAVPIYIDNELHAVFSIDNPYSADAFDEEAQNIAEVFANHISSLMQKLLTEQKERELAESNRLLVEAEQQLLKTDSKVFSGLSEALLASVWLQAKEISIYKVQEDESLSLEIYGPNKDEQKAIKWFRQEKGFLQLNSEAKYENYAARCITKEEHILINDTALLDTWQQHESYLFKSSLFYPIRIENKVWGCWQVSLASVFSDEKMNFVRNLSASLTLALLKQEKQQELELLAQFRQALLDITKQMFSQNSASEVYQTMLDAACKLIPDAEAASLLNRRRDGKFEYASGLGHDVTKIKSIIVSTEQLNCYDIASSHCCDLSFEAGSAKPLALDYHLSLSGAVKPLKSSLCVPIRVGKQIEVLLVFHNFSAYKAFTKLAKEMAEMFASHLSAALQSIKLQEASQKVAHAQELVAQVDRLMLEFRDMNGFFPKLTDLLLYAKYLRLCQITVFKLEAETTSFAAQSYYASKKQTQSSTTPYETLLSEEKNSVLHQSLTQRKTCYIPDVALEAQWVYEEGNPIRTILVCPIYLEQEKWGLIEFASYDAYAFEEQKQTLENISRSIELALVKQTDQEALALRLTKLTTLTEVGAKLQVAKQEADVFLKATEAVLERTRAEWSRLWLFNEATQCLDVKESIARGIHGEARLALSASLTKGQGFAWQAFELNQSIFLQSPQTSADSAIPKAIPQPKFLIASPLRNYEGKSIGVLVASSVSETAALNSEDIAFLEGIAQAAGNAIMRLDLLNASQAQAKRYQDLYFESDRQAKELFLLHKVRSAIATELNLKQLMIKVVEVVSESFGYAFMSVYLVEDASLVLQHQCGFEALPSHVATDAGVMARVLRTKLAAFVEDVKEDPDFLGCSELIGSEIAVPLLRNHQVIGILDLESPKAHALTKDDFALMQNLAKQVNLAIERAYLHEYLLESERRFRLLAENTNEVICLHSLRAGFSYLSPAVKAILGYQASDLVNYQADDLFHPDDTHISQKQLYKELLRKQSYQLTHRFRKKDGTYCWLETMLKLLKTEVGVSVLSSSRDVTERVSMQETLRFNALYDPLTRLANRNLFIDRINHALQKGWRKEEKFALVFIDLNRFKMINDSFGYDLGNQLLRSIAKRLNTMLRPEDTVARIANKSFCVLFEGLSEQEDLQTLVKRLDAILKPSFQFEDREIFIETSMGAVLNHSRYEQAEPMLRDAEIAMNRAKYKKLSYTIFDEFMYHDVVSRLNLETDLRYALKRNEFHFRYQPILDLKGETIIGVEALLRWQHGKEGNISPADFIPVAEESGLIIDIDKWVLKHALQEIAAWQKSPNNTAYVAINVSSQSLECSDFFDYLDNCLAQAQLSTSQLSLR